jgi:transcription elongation factor SPT5
MSLMNKSIDFAKKGHPLLIMSVTCSENVDQRIYVEAFKDKHVREAIAGLSCVLGGRIDAIPLEEYPVIYRNDHYKQRELRKHQWVRIKNTAYDGDLGIIEKIEDSRVIVRVVPRIEINKEVNKGPKDKFAKAKRIPHRMFNHNFFKDWDKRPDANLENHYFYYWKNQQFRKGFLFKKFTLKQIQSENVIPSIQEIQLFKSSLSMQDAAN